MSKVDWSLAPEGATHKVPNGCWYKIDGDQVFCWSNAGNWSGPYPIRQYQDGSMEEMVKRPKQPQAWSGPEDGLPPIDSLVMVHECTHDYTKQFNNQIVRIVAHDQGKYAVFAADNFVYHALVAEKFKLPPTPEQLAAEERERAINEMIHEHDHAGLRSWAIHVYDTLGYRKQ